MFQAFWMLKYYLYNNLLIFWLAPEILAPSMEKTYELSLKKCIFSAEHRL